MTHTLTERFVLLDKMREAAGVSSRDWASKAGINWLRFLKIKVLRMTPSNVELANLRRALERLSTVRA